MKVGQVQDIFACQGGGRINTGGHPLRPGP